MVKNWIKGLKIQQKTLFIEQRKRFDKRKQKQNTCSLYVQLTYFL